MGTNIQVCFTCLSTDLKFIRFENIDRNIAAFYERFVADGSDTSTNMQNLDYLCENCCMQLKNSYIFWKQCMQSKNRLGNYLMELENQRNYYRMQETRNNEIVVKNEDGENIVLMELGSTNTTSTSSQHHFNQNHNNEHNQFQDFNHHFGEPGNFGDPGVLKAEDDFQDQTNSYFMNNMDFDFNGEESSNGKRKSNKDLVKPYGCNLCSHKFVNKGNLKRHLAVIHQDPAAVKETQNANNIETYQCTYCPKKLQSQNNLNRHLLKHTNEGNFQCKKCPKTFNNKVSLLQHEETHSLINGMIYECDICKTEYQNLDEFRSHRALHDLEPQYKCSTCYKIFDSNESLGNHSCKIDEQDLTCLNCENKFDSVESLQIHNAQCDNMSFNCTYNNCNKSFPDKLSFKEHTKSHNSKLFSCLECPKKFQLKSKFEDHMNLHLGLKPYECMMCEKSFAYALSLDTHLKVHTSEENLYKCSECDKSFSSKTALKNHENIHKGYKCVECNAKFNSRRALYQHIKNEHKHKENKNIENNDQPPVLQPNVV